ncbi:MAG: ABC transporter ATP-binding protein [Acidobacteriota bacterium]
MSDEYESHTTDVVIEASALSKDFGEGPVLDGLDLSIERGSFYGLLGRNGAGKSTLLRLLMGLQHPTSGEARVLGLNLSQAPEAHRARVAYVSQNAKLHPQLTAEELADYVGHFYPKWDNEHARRVARRLEVPWDRPWAELSGGAQQGVALVLALASRPEVLLLDEPASSLDPVARRDLLEELIDLLLEGDGSTVVFSTHILSDMERPADTIGVLADGKMLLSHSIEELQGRARRVQAVFPGDVPAGLDVAGAWRSRREGRVLQAIVGLDDDAQLNPLREAGGSVDVFPLDLEELFVELLGEQESRS